jgi:hypothetical protein
MQELQVVESNNHDEDYEYGTEDEDKEAATSV